MFPVLDKLIAWCELKMYLNDCLCPPPVLLFTGHAGFNRSLTVTGKAISLFHSNGPMMIKCKTQIIEYSEKLIDNTKAMI